MSFAVHDRLEAAVSTTLVQLTYGQLANVDVGALTIAIFIFYGCVQAATRFAVHPFQRQLLLRCQMVLVGLAGCVFLAQIQISSAGAQSSAALVVPKLATVGCALVFLSIMLHGLQGQYNLVSICLFVFSDSVQGLLESAKDGLVVPVVATVVCIASPWLATALDARVPGLSVLCRALFMATINWMLDLIDDTSATAVGHCAMLLLLIVVIEVCKSVDPALDETQGYAIYRVTAVLAGYLRQMHVESAIVVVCAVLALLVVQRLGARWALGGLVRQILVLLMVGAIVADFKAYIYPLSVSSKGMALAALLLFFEGVKFAAASYGA